jgi:hypothetical protein
MYKSIWLFSLYFFIGFFSDIVLNYLSRQAYAPVSITALKVYFDRPSIKNSVIRDIVSAINAGLTVLVGIVMTMLLSYVIFNFAHPQTLAQLYRFLLLAFFVGYGLDVFIYKTAFFGPTLDPFYKIAGAGFWGAAAFIFSILVAYGFFYFF